VVLILAFIPFLWRRRALRLVGLGVVIVSMVIANAFVTATLAVIEDRLQSRVIWLLPFLAGLFVLSWFGQRSPGKAQTAPGPLAGA